jgi:hypothetical protein
MKYLLIILFPFLLHAQSFWWVAGFNDDITVDPTQYSVDLASASTEFMTKTSPTNTDISASDFSIMFWVKLGAASSLYKIINTDNNPTRGWDLFLNSAEKISFYSNAATGGGSDISLSALTAGTWYLILLTGEYKTATTDYNIYINSTTADKTETGAENVVSVTNTIYVGGWGYNNTAGFNGEIGELQVLKGHILTAGERTTLFTNGIQDSWSAGTVVMHYKWSGATDATFLNDESSSGNDLTGTNVTQAGDQVIYPAGYP